MTTNDPNQPASAALPFLAAFVSLLAFFALQDTAYRIAGSVIEYPLDDPYIHLAMAEQIRAGGYGVNAGEYAAAASSPLFPVLLLPFAGDEFHRLMPLVWNVIGLLCAALLWGRILAQSGYGTSVLGILLAMGGPLALHFAGVSFTGMEHSLHVAATLGIVSGLIRFLDTGVVGRLLLFAVFVSPLLRLEGLALALMAGLVVLGHRRIKPGLFLVGLAVVPVMCFALLLTQLGLDPVPSSVTSKMALPQGADGMGAYFSRKLMVLVQDDNATLLGGFLVVGALVLVASPWRRSLVLAVMAAAVAHLMFGRFGWMDRYEIYIVAAVAAALLSAAAADRRMQLLVLLPIAYAASVYIPDVFNRYPYSTRAVAVQQSQMARFAKEHLAEPVAVNDLGKVAWQNPDYVLDLWGLANHEAREIRLGQPGPGWVDDLTTRHGAQFAMIYTHWFPGGLGADWQHLGDLVTEANRSYLGADRVGFYVTGPQDAAPYLAKIAAWAEGLPEGATWEPVK